MTASGTDQERTVAIVDCGLGNLFSVARACTHVGLTPVITHSADDLLAARAIVVPGVGAFADAMMFLHEHGLVDVLREQADHGKPLLGVCLGMQLLMDRSSEFGDHPGLSLVDGTVERLPDAPGSDGAPVKVPQVGWNRLRVGRDAEGSASSWVGTLLDGLDEGAYLYFVHSYYVEPADPDVALAWTRYGSLTYCSALRKGNIYGVQFHPERSGPEGLTVYRNLARMMGLEPQEAQT